LALVNPRAVPDLIRDLVAELNKTPDQVRGGALNGWYQRK